MSNYATQPSEGGKAGGQGAVKHSADHGITGPSFDNMYAQKRSMDSMSKEKRENLADQKPTTMIGKIWRNAMSGPGGPNPSGGNS